MKACKGWSKDDAEIETFTPLQLRKLLKDLMTARKDGLAAARQPPVVVQNFASGGDPGLDGGDPDPPSDPESDPEPWHQRRSCAGAAGGPVFHDIFL